MTFTDTAPTTDEDALFDMVDRLADQLTETPQTPSALARKAKVRTSDTVQALAWMVQHDYCTVVGNGSWGKYRARRFGEYS